MTDNTRNPVDIITKILADIYGNKPSPEAVAEHITNELACADFGIVDDRETE